jgi:hypothetical protein
MITNAEQVRMWKEVVVAYLKVCTVPAFIQLERSRPRKTSVRIADNWTEILIGWVAFKNESRTSSLHKSAL